jgi:hypothetical protein
MTIEFAGTERHHVPGCIHSRFVLCGEVHYALYSPSKKRGTTKDNKIKGEEIEFDDKSERYGDQAACSFSASGAV